MKPKSGVLLVEPEFPIPAKSKNHQNFLPIGLLKLASYLRSNGVKIKLMRGYPNLIQQAQLLRSDLSEVWVTSLFTYWSRYVKETVEFYKRMFPAAKVIVGGIYSSLMPDQCKAYTGSDDVWEGTYQDAEGCFPAYDLVGEANPDSVDYQIIHTSRGCVRRCTFCGAWRIEPQFTAKDSIKDEIRYRKIVFYDNNLLANPHIENILSELIDLKRKKEILWCEAQSGFDGRRLGEHPELAKMLKEAGFRYPRIAWDGSCHESESIGKQIDLLMEGGYNSRDMFVFMLYNWNIPFEEIERKRVKCWEWQVQIADCRYRPLDQAFDNYDPRKGGQTKAEYYIHEVTGWTDALVKQFRKNVRRHNICVRHRFPFYSHEFEHKWAKKEMVRAAKPLQTRKEQVDYLQKNRISFWFPDNV